MNKAHVPTTRGERPRHGETAGEEVSGDFGDIFVFSGRIQRREEAVRTVAENQFSGLQRMASATLSAALAGSKAGSPLRRRCVQSRQGIRNKNSRQQGPAGISALGRGRLEADDASSAQARAFSSRAVGTAASGDTRWIRTKTPAQISRVCVRSAGCDAARRRR